MSLDSPANRDLDELRFDGRVAIVTGAGRGIGREHALLLASRGASVLVNDLGGATDGTGFSAEPAQQVVEEIRSSGGAAQADVNSAATAEGCKAIVAAAVRHFGRVDILICNAGGGRGAWSPMIDLNLSGTFWLSEAAWPLLKAQRYGRILTTSSAAGLFGMRPPIRGDGMEFYAYGAAKMGIVGLTRNLALEGARSNIKVNGIAPVAISRMSSQVPNPATVCWMETYFPPRHVANAAACLTHEDCPVSGEIFSVGGGRVAKIVVAQTDGLCDPQLTPESLMARLGTVLDQTRLHEPHTVDAEMSIYTRLLGTQGGPFETVFRE